MKWWIRPPMRQAELVMLLSVFLLSGCALLNRDDAASAGRDVASAARQTPTYSRIQNLPPQIKREYKPAKRYTRDDFIDQARAEGSLWHDEGQTNFYFIRNKVYHLGDMLTVNINEEMRNDIINELKKTLTPEEREAEYFARVRKDNESKDKEDTLVDMAKDQGKDPTKVVKETAKLKEKNKTAGEEEDDRLRERKDVLTAEVIDSFPNGTYRIRGVKQVTYRGRRVAVELNAMVSGKDITDTDMVEAEKLYENKVELMP